MYGQTSQSRKNEENVRVVGTVDKKVYKRHYFILFIFMLIGFFFIFYLFSFLTRQEDYVL